MPITLCLVAETGGDPVPSDRPSICTARSSDLSSPLMTVSRTIILLVHAPKADDHSMTWRTISITHLAGECDTKQGGKKQGPCLNPSLLSAGSVQINSFSPQPLLGLWASHTSPDRSPGLPTSLEQVLNGPSPGPAALPGGPEAAPSPPRSHKLVRPQSCLCISQSLSSKYRLPL